MEFSSTLLFIGHCHRSTVCHGSSVVGVLAQFLRGPGFKSPLSHVLFLPL